MCDAYIQEYLHDQSQSDIARYCIVRDRNTAAGESEKSVKISLELVIQTYIDLILCSSRRFLISLCGKSKARTAGNPINANQDKR